MRRIRVLVVDDAVAVRRLLFRIVAAEPDLEMVGTAATGAIALAKIAQLHPDVVTLDVEMPEMDGLQTLEAIRRDHPDLPVIMYSTVTRRGAEATLDALSRGATDYVPKPSNPRGAEEAVERVRAELVPRLRLFGGRLAGRDCGPPAARAPAPPPAPRAVTGPVEVVVIGVSTGGPNALGALLPSLPADLPVPILVVQHMPAIFTEMLAARLAQISRLPVAEAACGRVLDPGRVWLAPGNQHLVVERVLQRVRLRLHQGPPENSCRPSVDVLFRSAAEVYGSGALAVVMTGMGQDGLEGCRRIRAAGGQVITQDEPTSVVWGMPGFVARAGLSDAILPLERIGPEIVRRTTACAHAGEGTLAVPAAAWALGAEVR